VTIATHPEDAVPIPEDEFERTIIIGHKSAPDVTDAPDIIGHYLVVAKKGEEGARMELGAEPLTIGRDARQALALPDTEVSRLHARVSLINGDAVVEDLGSTNGTFLGGQRLTTPVTLKEGDVLSMGSHLLQYERRSRRDVERTRGLDRDLQKASKYVLSLLPPPLTDGPVLAEWRFVPSMQLGGDAFGYSWLDPNTFAFYLLDVSGHGAGSAMHSVTVLNVLRQRALPQVDFEHPAEVLGSLNDRFQMDSHGGLYFTMWYGVYRAGDRELTFSSAGHHPAFLVPADKQAATPLGMPALMIGAMPGVEYETQQVTLPAGSSVYLFSDGVFEVETTSQERWSLSDFEPMLLEPAVPGTMESDRLYAGVKRVTGSGPLDDDFSLMVLTFS
jgi:serine phosphatase RsbU (regulator of sigma subunit)